MTKECFLELYGNEKLTFSNYYKYVFTFKCPLENGNVLCCECGGSSEDIYRFGVNTDTEYNLYELDPFSGTIFDSDGGIVHSFYESC